MLIELLPYIAAMLASVAMLAFMFGLRRILRSDVKVDSRLSTYLEAEEGISEIDSAAASSPFAEKLNEVIKNQSFAGRIRLDLPHANSPLGAREFFLVRSGLPLRLAIVALLIWRSLLPVPVFVMLAYVLPIMCLPTR